MSTVVCSTVQPLSNEIFDVKRSENESESSESNSDEQSDKFRDDFENDKKEDDDENEDKIKKRHPCSFCEKQYSYKSWLKRHLTVYNKTFACDYCPQIFMKNYKLQMYTQVYTDPIKYKCSNYNASYNEKTNLNKHHNLKHNLNKKGISCDVKHHFLVEETYSTT